VYARDENFGLRFAFAIKHFFAMSHIFDLKFQNFRFIAHPDLAQRAAREPAIKNRESKIQN